MFQANKRKKIKRKRIDSSGFANEKNICDASTVKGWTFKSEGIIGILR